MSNINEMVLLEIGPVGLAGIGLGGWGGLAARGLGSGLGFMVGGPLGAMIGAGAATGGLNLLKNSLDPAKRHNYAGNLLSAVGAGVGGSVPILGHASAIYNGAGVANQSLNLSDQYNRQQALKNYVTQLDMIQKARAGNYSAQ